MTGRKSTDDYRIYTTAFDMEVSANALLRELSLAKNLESRPPEQVPSGDRITPASHYGTKPLVTLLVDHSGSLRGAPAQWTASALRQAAALLEHSGIAFELLGFTTVHWRGGKSRRQWADNWTPFPGRLCDLLHIVYQDARGNYPTWPQDLNLMNISDVLKENVDGEALLWAYQRAQEFKPDFWLCIVVSDGAPVDDSTLEANADWDADNPYPILCDHLQVTIAALDAIPNTHIAGFGINYDVREFYECNCVADTEVDNCNGLAQFLCRLLSEG